jgi:hypothetical protein
MSKINCEILRQALEKLPAPEKSGQIYIHKSDTRNTQLQDPGICEPNNNDAYEYLSLVFEATVYRNPSRGSWLEWELLIE